jgi:DNA repair exonuclease SbcCD ATPase subunit
MNVEDLAASRWKPIRQAREQIAKAQGAHARSSARLEELRGQIGPAEHRDRQALGRALVDGKAEPASEAAKLKQELEREERRLEALAVAVQAAHGQIANAVDANRGDWRRQAMQELSKSQQRYKDAIDALAAARQGLSDEATLVAWLDGGPNIEAASDPLSGRLGSDANGRHPLSFSRTLEELRSDCEHLSAHPVNRDDPAAWPRYELAWRGGR